MTATTADTAFAPDLSHFGMFVRDLDLMTRFYTEVFDLRLTDQGEGFTFGFPLRFLSGRSDMHHRLVLAASRGADAPSTVMQLSFKVRTLDHLREVRRRALARGGRDADSRPEPRQCAVDLLQHPEENTVEVYLDTPWYVSQPHGDPLDLDRRDEEIWAETERIVRADPSFMPAGEWSDRFRQGLGGARAGSEQGG